MKTNKENFELLIKTKERVEKIYEEFNHIFIDLFEKKDKLDYEAILPLDLEIYGAYLSFATLLVKLESTINDFDDENIKAIVTDILESKKISPDEYYKQEGFDMMFYSYLLCEMYIVLPFILEKYLIEELKIKKPNWPIEKNIYYIRTKKLPKYFSKTLKSFEIWDKTETRIERLPLDELDKHPSSTKTFIELKNKFCTLMNNFILIKFDSKISNKIISLTRLRSNWHWLTGLGTFVFGLTILLIIILSLKK